MMKATGTLLLIGFTAVSLNLALADDQPAGAFKKKGEDLRPHTEVHYHVHSDGRDMEASPETFQAKSGDFVREVHIHFHEHPDVRDAPADPESYIDKKN